MNSRPRAFRVAAQKRRDVTGARKTDFENMVFPFNESESRVSRLLYLIGI